MHVALSLTGGLAVAACVFLPWLRLGDVGLSGMPDPAGLFVLGIGVATVIVAVVAAVLRRPLPYVLMLAGIAAITTLIVVWRSAPEAIADRALARAQAVALVDNVPMQPVPSVRVGAGVYVGIAGGLVMVLAGAVGRRRGAGL